MHACWKVFHKSTKWCVVHLRTRVTMCGFCASATHTHTSLYNLLYVHCTVNWENTHTQHAHTNILDPVSGSHRLHTEPPDIERDFLSVRRVCRCRFGGPPETGWCWYELCTLCVHICLHMCGVCKCLWCCSIGFCARRSQMMIFDWQLCVNCVWCWIINENDSRSSQLDMEYRVFGAYGMKVWSSLLNCPLNKQIERDSLIRLCAKVELLNCCQ